MRGAYGSHLREALEYRSTVSMSDWLRFPPPGSDAALARGLPVLSVLIFEYVVTTLAHTGITNAEIPHYAPGITPTGEIHHLPPTYLK